MALARVVAGDDEGDGEATEGDDAGAGAGEDVLDTFLLEVLDFYRAFANSFARNLVLTYNLRHRVSGF